MTEMHGLSNYREMRITLTEVPAIGEAGLDAASTIRWAVRVKPLDADWGTGVVLAEGRHPRQAPLESLDDALYWLHEVLCTTLDARR